MESRYDQQVSNLRRRSIQIFIQVWKLLLDRSSDLPAKNSRQGGLVHFSGNNARELCEHSKREAFHFPDPLREAVAMTPRDILALHRPTDLDIMALKKISDRVPYAHDRDFLLSTCELIDNLRWANQELRTGLGSVGASYPERKPHPTDFSLDDDPEAYQKAWAKWNMAEAARAVLKRVEGIT